MSHICNIVNNAAAAACSGFYWCVCSVKAIEQVNRFEALRGALRAVYGYLRKQQLALPKSKYFCQVAISPLFVVFPFRPSLWSEFAASLRSAAETENVRLCAALTGCFLLSPPLFAGFLLRAERSLRKGGGGRTARTARGRLSLSSPSPNPSLSSPSPPFFSLSYGVRKKLLREAEIIGIFPHSGRERRGKGSPPEAAARHPVGGRRLRATRAPSSPPTAFVWLAVENLLQFRDMCRPLGGKCRRMRRLMPPFGRKGLRPLRRKVPPPAAEARGAPLRPRERTLGACQRGCHYMAPPRADSLLFQKRAGF